MSKRDSSSDSSDDDSITTTDDTSSTTSSENSRDVNIDRSNTAQSQQQQQIQKSTNPVSFLFEFLIDKI